MIRRGMRRAGKLTLVLIGIYFALGFLSSRISGGAPLISEEEIRRVDLSALDSLLPHSARGVMSVHSGRSHDAVGTFEEIAGAAESTGLDFVVLGDHPGEWARSPDPLRPRRIEGTLIVPGLELIVTDRGRVLVFGLDTLPRRWDAPLSELVRRVDPSEGFVSVVHPRSTRTREMWKGWEVEGVHAWESLDVSEMARARLAEPWAAYHVGSFLVSLPTGRGGRTVERLWRERSRTPAILAFDSVRASADMILTGGLNHHPKTRIGGRLFPAYEPFFRSVVNHLMLESPLADDPREGRRQLAGALRAGRLFVTLGDAELAGGFRYWVEGSDGRVVRSGGRAEHADGDRIMVRIPDAARGSTLVRIMRDGREVGYIPARPGEGLSIRLPEPGIYRVEVHHAGEGFAGGRFDMHPWILSNPIEVTEP